MESSIDETVSKLLSISMSCYNHQLNEDSYPSPGFSDFLNRALTVDDIPMQSSTEINYRPLRKDLSTIPWEDSIKNFIFDLTSVNTKQKFDICVLMTQPGYRYTDSTIGILSQKYLKDKAIAVDIVPTDVDCREFDICFRLGGIVQCKWTVERSLLVSNVCVWSSNSSMLIYCHDNSVSEYRDIIQMMPESTWSISCTPLSFIESKSTSKPCKYVCPVYSCQGSLETRAVGTGSVKFVKHKIADTYEGKLNYYLKSIRGSRHSSGKCYDCEILYKTLISVHRSPLSSPANPRTIKFSDQFLHSTSEQ